MSDHLAAISARVPAGIEVYTTDVPTRPPQRYVILRAPLFEEVSSTLAYNPDVDDYLKVMYCGLTDEQARWVARHVYAALHRSRPAVAGYSTWLHRTATGEFDVDRQRDPHIYHATDLYRYRATPA